MTKRISTPTTEVSKPEAKPLFTLTGKTSLETAVENFKQYVSANQKHRTESAELSATRKALRAWYGKLSQTAKDKFKSLLGDLAGKFMAIVSDKKTPAVKVAVISYDAIVARIPSLTPEELNNLLKTCKAELTKKK